ncbi:MAG: DUF4831 family protein [Bacteroidales bacterium]|nr:DUF4831 family protein [Bacteroidales bacterium]
MNRMKTTLAALAFLWAATALQAQEVSYFLPSTTLTLEVEAQQETFFAGPYAAFAKRMLNLDVRKVDAVTTHVLSVELKPSVEADLSARYTLETEVPEVMELSAQGLVSFADNTEAGNARWHFLPGLRADFSQGGITGPDKQVTRVRYKTVPTDTAFVRKPVEERGTETKTLEDKAAEAAEIILRMRKERMNIATGNTDASFSGEALADALAELRRIEEEYLVMFKGYTVTRPLQASFDIIPQPGSKTNRYLAFRLDPDQGLVSNGRGTPYYLEVEPEQLLSNDDDASAKKAKGTQIHYRIPMICKIRLTEDGRTLLQSRQPIYQLGKDATYPAKNN